MEINKTDILQKQLLLSDLRLGFEAEIIGIKEDYRGEGRRRLLDLGFVRGTRITVQNVSPLGNPIAYNLRDTLIALRKEQADCILIKIIENE